jgi:hypothetical protein
MPTMQRRLLPALSSDGTAELCRHLPRRTGSGDCGLSDMAGSIGRKPGRAQWRSLCGSLRHTRRYQSHCKGLRCPGAFRALNIINTAPGLRQGTTDFGWEWVQREADIFARFEVGHYRPKERPNAVRVVHEKTGEENWIPLLDPENDAPLFPELMAELDAIKKVRIAGLMLRRDWGKQGPWATFPREGEVGLSQMSRKVKQVIRAAGLRDELTFTSFRHGGFTEAADNDLTDAEMRALGRHKSAKVLPRYAKQTMRQVAKGARKRRAGRTKQHDLSE